MPTLRFSTEPRGFKGLRILEYRRSTACCQHVFRQLCLTLWAMIFVGNCNPDNPFICWSKMSNSFPRQDVSEHTVRSSPETWPVLAAFSFLKPASQPENRGWYRGITDIFKLCFQQLDIVRSSWFCFPPYHLWAACRQLFLVFVLFYKCVLHFNLIHVHLYFMFEHEQKV